MKRMKSEGPEIPITPMLDMAFQLLTFFILTFKPVASEVQFAMNLLPAQPATSMEAPALTPENASSDLPASLRTLPTTLRAAPDGSIGRVTLGDNEIQGMDQLSKELGAILQDKTLPFDQALIKADPKLHWAELIKVIDVFNKNKVMKVSLAELGSEPEGAPQ